MMRGFWSETNWRLEHDALLMPNGQRLLLKHIMQWRADHLMGNVDLSGKWPGWKVRQQYLIAPGGSMRQGRIPEHVMRHLVQVHDTERVDLSRRQLVLF